MTLLHWVSVPCLCVLAACGGADDASETAADAPEMVDVLKQDLKNMATDEEIYFSENRTYSASLEAIGFTPSAGVSVDVAGDSSGWMAVATSEDENEQCVLRFGRPPHEPENRVGETNPGAIVCAGAP